MEQVSLPAALDLAPNGAEGVKAKLKIATPNPVSPLGSCAAWPSPRCWSRAGHGNAMQCISQRNATQCTSEYVCLLD